MWHTLVENEAFGKSTSGDAGINLDCLISLKCLLFVWYKAHLLNDMMNIYEIIKYEITIYINTSGGVEGFTQEVLTFLSIRGYGFLTWLRSRTLVRGHDFLFL